MFDQALPPQFFVGNAEEFLKAELLRNSASARKKASFIGLFDEDDRYYAINLFEEKPLLVISKADPMQFGIPSFDVYSGAKTVYNLSVRDDREFFVETCSQLDYLKELCTFFGFDYELDET